MLSMQCVQKGTYKIICQVIERTFYHLLSRANGKQSYQQCKKGCKVLPAEQDGKLAVRRVKTSFPLRNTFVLCSSFNEEEFSGSGLTN